METFLEILKYILPSLVVVLVVWLMLRKGLANEAERRNFELRKQTANQMTPTRLRAYERFTLFLERTKPEAMLLRYDNLSSMTTATLQQKLLETVRDEFNHNASQQIYISDEAWKHIVTAKESVIQLINQCSGNFASTENAIALAQLLIQTYAATEVTPTDLALKFLKQEVNLF
ncbi:MAG: hypothetical protein KBB61_05050 [Paludibacteraceae bacterium]|jgi:hypothetical protein|nr:hypothetical protein [Paludibacteraceae bacterium]MDI9536930.1 hypothetical protein [Bacteroidota bacterium]HHT61936.1 hypothetical protein [Bacteroidales bacterium]MBP9039645.1 hypothetical protein [Paludibacteraceae bacterium]HOA46675.1 hypothetical protein [Paludibacteraceae bacterium]